MPGKRFEKQLEYLKIPEHYDQYIDYARLKQKIKAIRQRLQKSYQGKKISESMLTQAFSIFENQTSINSGEESMLFRHQSQRLENINHSEMAEIGRKQSFTSPMNILDTSLTQSLFPIETTVIEFSYDYLEELKRTHYFFIERAEALKQEFQSLKDKYEHKAKVGNRIQIDDKTQRHKLGQEKDDFEYATSWKRAFQQINAKFTWLTSYAQINKIAALRLLKMLANKTLEGGENAKFYQLLVHKSEQYQIFNPKRVTSEIKQHIEYFAMQFTGKNLKQAKKQLFGQSSLQIRTKDFIPIAFFSGIIISCLVFLIFFSSIPSIDGLFHSGYIYRVFPVYRCTLVFFFLIFATGVVIYFIRKYKVNYVFIFEIDPHLRMNEFQFYKIFLFLFMIWSFCALMELLGIKGYTGLFSDGETSGFALILVMFSLLILIWPFKSFYSHFRMELLYSLFQTVIAPFGYVRFKDFFLGDVLTSITKPLVDLAFVQCYFVTDAWKVPEKVNLCTPSNLEILILTYLPFHFRFWQCVNRYYYTKMAFPHLVNAGKYMASILVFFVQYFRNEHQLLTQVYVPLYVTATLYSYAWDIVMDWGLLRGTVKGRRLLRDRLKYPPFFYYFAAITNLMLRFAWIFTLVPIFTHPSPIKELQLQVLFLSLAEAYRRSQWSLFRVENENVNNFEKYRAIMEIPKFPEEMDISKVQL